MCCLPLLAIPAMLAVGSAVTSLRNSSGQMCLLLQDASPVCIIHGPFGSGKSSLLMALIHYLLAQRSQQGSGLKGCRVLLSAHTNIAVDRLMTGLQDTGCTGAHISTHAILRS